MGMDFKGAIEEDLAYVSRLTVEERHELVAYSLIHVQHILTVGSMMAEEYLNVIDPPELVRENYLMKEDLKHLHAKLETSRSEAKKSKGYFDARASELWRLEGYLFYYDNSIKEVEATIKILSKNLDEFQKDFGEMKYP